MPAKIPSPCGFSFASHALPCRENNVEYPVGDFDQNAADLSVDHPRVVENYRVAHEIALRQGRGPGNTEDLRRAMVSYRTLFEDLLETAEKPQEVRK